MSLLSWAIGLSIADHLLGEVDEREERQKRENDPPSPKASVFAKAAPDKSEDR